MILCFLQINIKFKVYNTWLFRFIEQNRFNYSFITIRKFIIFQFPLNKFYTIINRRILIRALTQLSNSICQCKSYFVVSICTIWVIKISANRFFIKFAIFYTVIIFSIIFLEEAIEGIKSPKYIGSIVIDIMILIIYYSI